MVCLRCGYCCKTMMVIIVDNPDLGLIEENLIVHEGGSVPCKHLRGDKPGQYSCAVHDKDWYKETPCFAFTQIESNLDQPCRLGKHLLNKQIAPVS